MRRFGDNKDNKDINKKPEVKNLGNKLSIEDISNKAIEKLGKRKAYDTDAGNKMLDVKLSEGSGQRRRLTSTETAKKRARRKETESSSGKWFKKSLFVVGNIRFSRMAVGIFLLTVIVLASGSIALAAGAGLFGQVLPHENEDLIPAKLTVFIYDADEIKLVQSNGGTVNQLLKDNNIGIGENDKIEPSNNTVLKNRMRIEIQRAKKLMISTIEGETELTMYSGTVADALNEAGIEYDENDLITPAADTALTDGIAISYDEVSTETVTEEVVVEYETEYGETPTVLKGYYAITQKGKDGLAEVTYEVTYVNGEETTKKAVEENMIIAPVNKVVLNGTGLSRAGSGDGESSGADVPNPGQQATNPTIPGTTSTYVDVVVAHVTAYTHTGNTTATGTWPRSTRTLENPGTCAVVPSTFPYGSLIYIPGYGYAIAEDTGGFRHDPDRWNQIDLFMNTVDECLTWGRRREWTVYVVRYGY